VYVEFLGLELSRASIAFQSEVVMPVSHKGTIVPMGLRRFIV